MFGSRLCHRRTTERFCVQDIESMFRLNRFRITTRIYSGFGCLIMLGLAIAICGLWQLSAIERAASLMATLEERATNNLDSMRELQAMRRSAIEYQALNDKAGRDRFAEAYSKVSDLLKTAARDNASEERG